jgi:serine protease Do
MAGIAAGHGVRRSRAARLDGEAGKLEPPDREGEAKMGELIHQVGDWARRRKVFAALVSFLTLGVGIMIGSVISGRVGANRAPTPSGANLLSVPNPVRLSSAFATIAAQVEPAVVNISTTQVYERPQARNHTRPQPNDPFGDFFNHWWDSPQQPEAEKSLGSGVIVDPKGFILTNEHVIDGATKIQVTLNGGNTKYAAQLIGKDDETDVAVVKIDAGRALPTARLGNSDGVQVGDWVLAFGSPFGLQSSVTAGIISAKDRSNIGQQLQHFIQTDAAINPGNSGGPLVNMAGEVVGINTAIYTGGRSFEGVGFALPSSTAINVYNQLVSQGHVTRGSIGVTFQEDRSSNPIALHELGAPYGMILETVNPGSPAARAGLQPGDVIFSINGNPVHSGNDLVNPILQTVIGQWVKVGYIRDGKRGEVSVQVADRDKLFPTQVTENDEPSASPAPAPTDVGAQVDELTPELAGRVGISSRQKGVIVREVEPASFADDIGLQRGDVIVEVNHVPVYTLADYKLEMSKIRSGQDVMFKVVRRYDQNQTLTLFLAGVMPVGK